jgi:hypothetical protein
MVQPVSRYDDAFQLLRLWEEHDILERNIIALSRKFTDQELDELHEGEIPKWMI